MNEFREMKVAACGQYSQVFSAKAKGGKQVALKKYIKKSITRQRVAPAILKEIETMAQLGENPYTVCLLKHFEDRDAIYLVLEYMNGGSLQQKLQKDKKLSEKETSFYILLLANALEFLHSKNIVHRNLKLENILLKKASGQNGIQIKLCDFGWSTLVHHQDGIFNSLDHYGPEQFNLQPQTEAIDIWSLGVLMYQLLTGRLPFEPTQQQLKNKKRPDVLQANIVASRFTCHFLSDGAKDLLTWIFQVNPQNRPTAKQIKEHWWVKGTERPSEKINLISVLEDEIIPQEQEVQPTLEQLDNQILLARHSVKIKIQQTQLHTELSSQSQLIQLETKQLQEVTELEQLLQKVEKELQEIKTLNLALKNELQLQSEDTIHLIEERVSIITYENYCSQSRQEFYNLQKNQLPLLKSEKFCLEQTINQQQVEINNLKDIQTQIEINQVDYDKFTSYINELQKTKKILEKQIEDLLDKVNFMRLEAGLIQIQQEIELKLSQATLSQSKVQSIQDLRDFMKIKIQQLDNHQEFVQEKELIQDLSQFHNEGFPEKKQQKINQIKFEIENMRQKQSEILKEIQFNTEQLQQKDEHILQENLNIWIQNKEKMNLNLQSLQQDLDNIQIEVEKQKTQISELENQKTLITCRPNIVL